MNKIIAFICCLVLCKTTFAQKDSLAFDDRGKYIYYKIANADQFGADGLYKKSIGFFETNTFGGQFKLTLKDDKNTILKGSGFFIVYNTSMAKHPDGQIAYNLQMEIKGNKYRYWLTDFVYKPYFRDRYNNYVADKGVEVELERSSKNISEKELNRYLNETALFARHLGDKLKKYLATPVATSIKKDTAKKVIHIDKW